MLPWLITESVGHTAPDRSWDPEQVQTGTMRVHLNVQNTAAGKANIAGAMGWVAFDYNTTFVTPPSCVDFTCYHGVSDIFRIPKIAASAFASQRDPALLRPVRVDRQPVDARRLQQHRSRRRATASRWSCSPTAPRAGASIPTRTPACRTRCSSSPA